jgi:fructose-1,6-bisphosphatase/inositol monophosphatase family enzyme
MRRFGGDCYAYAMLACGHVDAVVESGLQPYDYLPLVTIVEGSGGIITDWNGKRLTFVSDGRVIAAATATLHREALAYLRD